MVGVLLESTHRGGISPLAEKSDSETFKDRRIRQRGNWSVKKTAGVMMMLVAMVIGVNEWLPWSSLLGILGGEYFVVCVQSEHVGGEWWKCVYIINV